jgi:hypothetical protein
MILPLDTGRSVIKKPRSKKQYFVIVKSPAGWWHKGDQFQRTDFIMSLREGCFPVDTIFKCPDGVRRTVKKIIQHNQKPYFTLVNAQGETQHMHKKAETS